MGTHYEPFWPFLNNVWFLLRCMVFNTTGEIDQRGHYRETTGGLTTGRAFWQNHQEPLNTGGNWRGSLQEQFINGALSRRHWGIDRGEPPGSTEH